jgi:hypothetical protein
LYYNYIKVIVDGAVHSEHGKLIKCYSKLGEIYRSTQKGYLSSRQYIHIPPPIKIQQLSSGILFYPILTVLKNILEA